MDPKRPMFNPFFYPPFANTQVPVPVPANTQVPVPDMSYLYPNPYPNLNDLQVESSQSQSTPTIIPENSERPMDNTQEVPTPVETQQISNQRHRWFPPDDLHLCSAWLFISKDPQTGTDQGSDCFWDRIAKRYNETRKPPLEKRNRQSLKNQWGKLSHDCQKFSGCMSNIQYRRQSGGNDGNERNNALALFLQNQKKPFRFMHAWDVLKHEEKWMTHVRKTNETTPNRPSGQKRSTATSGSDYNSNSININEDSDAASPPRPRGKKASKAKGKEKEVSAGSTKKKEEIEAQHKIDVDRTEAINRVSKSMELAARASIMNMDTSTMTTTQRKLYDKTVEMMLRED